MRLVSASPEVAAPRAIPLARPRSEVRAESRPGPISLFGIATTGLVLTTVLTRIPFMTHTLYAFDSANYALAVRDFYNVAFHQPHPPGYPLYVFVARVINLLVNDANRALIVEGILWSAVGVGCITVLARSMFGRTVGLLSGLLLVGTVGFWGYGEVAYPYVALAGETAALGLLAHAVLRGRRNLVLAFAVVWAISLGVRWDGAIFCLPLGLWALWAVGWRLRGLAASSAIAIVVAFAVPMIVLTGGLDVYRQAIADYLRVWSPQSAYVVGDFASGGDTQAGYNLNFLVNYLRQMLGVGLLLVLYLFGRRFAPAVLAADYRSRFLAVWTVPPLLVYVFAHLGEPGYVLSLAPQAAILIALSITDLRDETIHVIQVVHARGWHLVRWISPRVAGVTVAAALTLGILGWNVQAFARGVGPGRLPDLRAHDATTAAQVDFIEHHDVETTFVLAHDIFRQLHYYVPQYQSDLLYSEYVPDFQTTLTHTQLPAGTQAVVVLDSPLRVVPPDAAHEVVLQEQPRVSVWLVNAQGATAVEHGYQFVRLIR